MLVKINGMGGTASLLGTYSVVGFLEILSIAFL